MKNIPLFISILLSDNVVVMPTDTVYGLACSALSPLAVKRMYEIKKREKKPGTIIAANKQQLLDLGFEKSDIDRALQFWPGPVSVVLSAGDKLNYLHMGLNSLAVRIPEPEWLQDILIDTGPLATTSANFPGEPTITSIDEARRLFGDLVGYIDGGVISNSQPSSIIRLLPNGDIEKLR